MKTYTRTDYTLSDRLFFIPLHWLATCISDAAQCVWEFGGWLEEFCDDHGSFNRNLPEQWDEE